MNVIKTLKEIQYLKLDVKYSEDKLREMVGRRTSIKSSCDASISPGSHVTNTNNNMADSMISIESLQAEIIEKNNRIKELQREIDDKLVDLEPKERIIIKLHYMEGETLEYICGVIKYSWRHTIRLHKKALEKLKKVS